MEKEIEKNKETKLNKLEELKAENQISAELLERQEALMARREALHAEQLLGGTSEAGQPSTEKKEETPKEYNDRIEKEISEGKHD